MIHPTSPELFEFIDGRLGKAETGKIAAHLTVCAPCRRIVELEHSMGRIVKGETLVKAPASLAASVMINLSTPSRDSLALRFLSKLGSLVAMLIVLAIIGFAISQVSSTNDQYEKTSHSITQFVAPVSEMYEKGLETFVQRSSTITRALEATGDVQFWKTVFIIALTIGALAAADRVVGRRFIKLRP
ncbi:MAG: hypothetical protein WBZ48_04885 [Bacteroidota bacterium]